MTDKLKITGKSRAAILAALYNNSQPLGMGVYAAIGAPTTFSSEDAQALIDKLHALLPDRKRISLDYVHGRPIKVGFEEEDGDDFLLWPRLYDRDNGGDGTCARLIESVPS